MGGGTLSSALVVRIHKLDKVHPCLPHNLLLQFRPAVYLRDVLHGTKKVRQRRRRCIHYKKIKGCRSR